jgi:TctA family transporter
VPAIAAISFIAAYTVNGSTSDLFLMTLFGVVR